MLLALRELSLEARLALGRPHGRRGRVRRLRRRGRRRDESVLPARDRPRRTRPRPLGSELGPRVAAATGVALVGLGTIQALDARGWVDDWADVERDRQALVREAAARSAGGCVVDVIGLNVELVQALPVLAPLADEAGRDVAGASDTSS